MLVFVGAMLFMLLRLWQMKSVEVVLQSGMAFYHRWWIALLASLVGVAIVAVAG